jgi:hypothetical protein
MIFRIPSGKHRARPLRFGIWWRRKYFAWNVLFTESCRYNLGPEDQGDTNKLVGIGYLIGWFRPANTPWWKLWAYHHKDSARFGWRYSIEQAKIEILAYCYVNKERIIQPIGFFEIGKWYRIELYTSMLSYLFMLFENNGDEIADVKIKHSNKKKLQYRLGIYFGGNKPVPWDLKIQLEKA